ncbi:TPA: hypothetical protein DEP58_02640 [Patescibacteria group bacterium]|nr:MAG: hypothetical protein UU98_C0011G0005 [Parcubacteria group bacterium GW2011_GWD2_42_14]HCC05180.1 hypothetical protein [Patescibacteria group bacterium]
MLHRQKEYLIRLIRRVLAAGGTITVYGWRDSNHNPQTRECAETERIRFTERKSKIVGVQGDLVIFTKYIKHADMYKMQGKFNVYPRACEISTIKSILLECESLIVRKKIQTDTQHFDFTGVNPGVITQDINELEKFLLLTEVIVDSYDKFASEFKAHAEKNPQKLVGAHAVGRLLKEVGLKVHMRDLIKGSWLEPVVQPGKKKVGWYKAGNKLQSRLDADKKEEPSDPIEKAIFLRDRKPFIAEKIAEIQKNLEFWQNQIVRVEKAEDLLRQLGEL